MIDQEEIDDLIEDIVNAKPRDRKDLGIVDCPVCSHRQLYPLLSEEELIEEYNEDKTVRSNVVKIAPGSDFESMRKKFREWTKIHADMYWDKLQFGLIFVSVHQSKYQIPIFHLFHHQKKKFSMRGPGNVTEKHLNCHHAHENHHVQIQYRFSCIEYQPAHA